MAPLYKPPTNVTTCAQPFLALVTRADPSFQKYKYREVVWEFDHRVFIENPYQQGIYDGGRSNVYPVGAQYGGLDPLIQAARAPTVGNEVPGLYEAVPDGKGWA
jgi:hypothetical protein